MEVRTATVEDIPALIAMGRAMHEESPRYQNNSYSPAKLDALARRMLGTCTTPGEGGLFVAVRGEEIVGMMVAFVVEQFFSTDKIASDYALYVKPEYRKVCRAAVMLLDVFEAWALAQGAHDLIPGVSTMIDAESVKRFYEKRGYEPYGYILRKRIK